MKKHLSFIYRFTLIHFLTYFFIGLITYFTKIHSISYYEENPIEITEVFFRSSQSALVIAGPLFQILRGMLMSLAILPIKEVFVSKERGWLYLWCLLLVLSILAPAGAAPGSIEGLIYTNLPAKFHILYLPELIIQTGLFSVLFIMWEKNRLKKFVTKSFAVVSVIIIMMLIAGIFQYS